MFEQEHFEVEGANKNLIIGDITFSNTYPECLVIFVHGHKGFKDWGTHHLVAPYFASKGINFIKFNFSHSGVDQKNLSDITDLDLFASNTPSKELFDLEQVIDFAKAKFPNQKITLMGHSRGGALSILQASKNQRIHKLITWAAIGAFRNLWKLEEEANWRAAGVLYTLNSRTQQQMPLNITLLEDVLTHQEEFDLQKVALHIKKPWLIVQGTADPAVKTDVAINYQKLQPNSSKLLLIENGDHVFGAHHPYLKEELPSDLEKVCLACADFILKDK